MLYVPLNAVPGTPVLTPVVNAINTYGYFPSPSMTMTMVDGNNLLDSRVTFTRADSVTCATYFNSSGVLATAAANVARFDYDPSTTPATPRGLLIEESRTNLLTYSRDMTNAAWTKTDTTPTRTQVGIDGTANSACLMTEGSTLTAYTITAAGATVTAGATITASLVMKYGNCPWIRINCTDQTGANGYAAWFNIQTGTLGSTGALGTGTAVTSSITNLGGGWYRCVVSCIPSGSYTSAGCSFNSASANGNTNRVSGATYTVDMAQLEVGAFATSPIATTSAAVTRAADTPSMSGVSFTSWWNASQGTFVAKGIFTSQLTTNSYPNLFDVSDGTVNNQIQIFKQSNLNSVSHNVTVATTSYQNADGVPNIGVNKAAISYIAGTSNASLNGAAVVSSSPPSIPAMSNLQLGKGWWAGDYLNGWLQSLVYYPTALSSAQLQALTT